MQHWLARRVFDLVCLLEILRLNTVERWRR